MSSYTNINGVWRAAAPSANINGTWRNVTEAWVNINGTWRSIAMTRATIGTISGNQTSSSILRGTWSAILADNRAGFGIFGCSLMITPFVNPNVPVNMTMTYSYSEGSNAGYSTLYAGGFLSGGSIVGWDNYSNNNSQPAQTVSFTIPANPNYFGFGIQLTTDQRGSVKSPAYATVYSITFNGQTVPIG